MKGNSARGALRLLIVLSLMTFFALAQQASTPNILAHPEVNGPVHFDVSRPLRDLSTEVQPQMGFHVASPVRYPHLQALMRSAQQEQPADGALQLTERAPVAATLGLNLLGVGNGFPGYSVPDAPPD